MTSLCEEPDFNAVQYIKSFKSLVDAKFRREKNIFGGALPETPQASAAPDVAAPLQDVHEPASTAPEPAAGLITPRATRIPATPPELLSTEKHTENKVNDDEDAGLSSKPNHCNTIAALLPKARIVDEAAEQLTRSIFGSPIPTQNMNNNDEQDGAAKDNGHEQQQLQAESDLLQEIGLPA